MQWPLPVVDELDAEDFVNLLHHIDAYDREQANRLPNVNVEK